MRTDARRAAGGAFGFAVLLAALFFFAPVQVGGSTSYVVTEGISMLPKLHGGDLAVVRTHSSYRVGESVLYDSPVLHRPVLHRIVAIQDGRYFFKGDNNNFVDPGAVPQGALVGELWFRVPHAGSWVAWLGTPLHVALIAAVAAFLLLVGRRQRRRRRSRRRGTPGLHAPTRPSATRHHTSALDLSGLLLPLAAVALLAGSLSAVAFTKPTERMAEARGAYEQTGNFTYVARLSKPIPAYPSGFALTGQPLLLSLFDRVTVRFNYQLDTRLPHRIEGTIALDALVAAQTTWHQTFPVQPAHSFGGDATSIGGSVDLRAARAFLDQVSAQSGVVGADFDVDLRAIVHITGFVGAKRIDETFRPVLPFTVNHQLVKLKVPAMSITAGTTYNAPENAGLSSILNPSQPGSVPRRVTNHLAFARLEVPVQAVRWLGLLLAALAALAIYTLAIPHRNRRTRREHELIQGRYGHLIVPAVHLNPDGRSAVDVPDFPSLVRLAKHYEQLILHEQRDGLHTYAIDEDGRLYTYCIDPSKRAGLESGEDHRKSASTIPTGSARVPAPSSRIRRRAWLRPAALLAALALAATLATSITASNTVPVSHVGKSTQILALSQLAPVQCAGMSLTSLVVMATGATSVTGTSGNDLILGRSRAGNTTFSGGNGDDCIVGGGGTGTKTLSGGNGSDICIGATGSLNTFSSCTKSYG